MGLYGNIDTMSVTELFEWVNRGRKSGTLEVERDKIVKRIMVREGRVVGCSSNAPTTLLGQFLLSRGKITRQVLSEAMRLHEQSSTNLGETLIEMGAISLADQDAFIDNKIEETIFGLFDWPEAVFRFYTDALPDPNALVVDLGIREILERGDRRTDERERSNQAITDPGVVLRRTGGSSPPELEGHVAARRIYELIDGKKTVAEILLHSHAPEFLVTKFLTVLIQARAVEVSEQPAPAAPVPEQTPSVVAESVVEPLKSVEPVVKPMVQDVPERDEPVVEPSVEPPVEPPVFEIPETVELDVEPPVEPPIDEIPETVELDVEPPVESPVDEIPETVELDVESPVEPPVYEMPETVELDVEPADEPPVDDISESVEMVFDSVPDPAPDLSELAVATHPTVASTEEAELDVQQFEPEIESLMAAAVHVEEEVTIDVPAAPTRAAVEIEARPRAETSVSTEPQDSRELQDEINVALQLMSNGQPEAALELLNAMAAAHPGDISLSQLAGNAERDYRQKMIAGDLQLTKIPTLTEIAESNPDEKASADESFLLAQIDGSTDIQALLWVTPMRDIEVLKSLSSLLRRGWIEMREAD